MKKACAVLIILFVCSCRPNRVENTNSNVSEVKSTLSPPTDSTQRKSQSYASNNDTISSRLRLEDTIYDLIGALPEVQDKSRFIDSFTHHKHGVSLMIVSSPTKTDPYYWVAAGYNGDLRFETYMNFAVEPKTKEIKYLDVSDNALLTLKEWRKKFEKFE